MPYIPPEVVAKAREMDLLTYDVLEMSGCRAVWPEVLAVYAVKTSNGSGSADSGRTTAMNPSRGKRQVHKHSYYL